MDSTRLLSLLGPDIIFIVFFKPFLPPSPPLPPNTVGTTCTILYLEFRRRILSLHWKKKWPRCVSGDLWQLLNFWLVCIICRYLFFNSYNNGIKSNKQTKIKTNKSNNIFANLWHILYFWRNLILRTPPALIFFLNIKYWCMFSQLNKSLFNISYLSLDFLFIFMIK